MTKINLGRVLLSGLVTGLVLNIGEFLLNDIVLAKQMEDILRRFNVEPPGGSFIATATVLTFVLGILIALIYALIRPRLGPGPKAAIVAGVAAWFGVYVYSGIINGMLLAISFNLILIAIVWGLAEYVLAALAGAWLYKET